MTIAGLAGSETEFRRIEILRAAVFHTPRNPFFAADALVAHAEGALAIADGRIVACDDYSSLAKLYPDALVRDLRGGYLLPGFIDTHVHFPQVRILGGLGVQFGRLAGTNNTT